MSTTFYSLERYFDLACQKHPQLQHLKSQWDFDKELISKALQNVNIIFSHYSRHDASHSNQIIINIERLLGDKMQYLSATDLWLILESAYNHDIGMVITKKQIQDIDSEEFQNFIKQLAMHKDHELSLFAQNWLDNQAILPQKSASHDFIQQYTQLLAEWFRKKHPLNSANIVRNPVEEIGLNSSRNELLPKRLFNILAKICKAHGSDFDDMIAALPKAEAGLATEDCHPRYVACLLRIADLLDIDDNRFCPVMMSIHGNNLPIISKAHKDKHLSVQHFRLDSERIEIECHCPTPESYETAFDWFEWLKFEYHKQTQYWDKIVPSETLGRLPTLMNPVVKIQKPFLIIQEGKKPSFNINKQSLLNLIRGTGLYSSYFDSIREILQNAIDATLYRIWIENKHKYDFSNLSPIDTQFVDLVNNYKIDVELKEDGQNIWLLTIKDQGIGISINDLTYMLEIGGSRNNTYKQKILEEMPTWFKPSGIFGIGLQSAFLLADEFYITSRSIFDQKNLKIHFHKIKGITIEEVDNITSYGCEFKIAIRIEKFPERYSYSFDDDINFQITNRLKEYDITSPSFRLDFVKRISLINKIKKFSLHAPIKINIKNAIAPSSLIKEKEYYYFSKEHNILLSNIRFEDKICHIHTFFRGQRIPKFLLRFTGIQFDADIYSDSADKLLSYNRESVLPEADSNIRKKIYLTISEYIIENFNNLSDEDKPFAALNYLLTYPGLENKNKNIIKYINKLQISFFNKPTLSLEKLLHKIYNNEIPYISEIDTDYTINYNIKKNEYIINNSIKSEIIKYLLFYFKNKNLFYCINQETLNTNQFIYKTTYQFYKNDTMPVTNTYMRKIIQNKFSHTRGCRLFFPAWGEFRDLAIKEKATAYGDIFKYTIPNDDLLILPINFNLSPNDRDLFWDSSEKFINWIYTNRKNSEITLEGIIILNNKLIDHLKNILN
ncbi:ATP-binding protein [Gallibacterium melopsittaci]|uniref:ATP-binding protein n=1 Tax=Gallibacterium melopsittaci TaxID=516063 RepID=A0ABV6HTC0_9PAST